MLQIFLQLFSENFFAHIFAPRSTRTHIRTRARAYIYKTLCLWHICTRRRAHHKAHEKRPVCSFTIFKKRFLQNYLFVWFIVYNFAGRYMKRRGNDRNERREMYPRARKQQKRNAWQLVIWLLDKLLTNVKKWTRQQARNDRNERRRANFATS